MIQWTSIGKPILIYDAMIAIAFISFIKNQNNTNLKILLISLILSICIKITALISVFPIIVLLLFRYWKNLLDIIFNATNRDIILIGSSLFLLFTSSCIELNYGAIQSFLIPRNIQSRQIRLDQI